MSRYCLSLIKTMLTLRKNISLNKPIFIHHSSGVASVENLRSSSPDFLCLEIRSSRLSSVDSLGVVNPRLVV